MGHRPTLRRDTHSLASAAIARIWSHKATLNALDARACGIMASACLNRLTAEEFDKSEQSVASVALLRGVSMLPASAYRPVFPRYAALPSYRFASLVHDVMNCLIDAGLRPMLRHNVALDRLPLIAEQCAVVEGAQRVLGCLADADADADADAATHHALALAKAAEFSQYAISAPGSRAGKGDKVSMARVAASALLPVSMRRYRRNKRHLAAIHYLLASVGNYVNHLPPLAGDIVH